MNSSAHDIRLAAGFEIPAASSGKGRTLSRIQAEQLVAALAADLARTIPQAAQSMLVIAGSIFEPGQLLRPGLPAWTALSDAAAQLIREQGLAPRLLAIGSHQGRLPDQRLTPPAESLQSQFVAVPMLLIADHDIGPELENTLERELFERGSIDPPARALLNDFLDLDSVHGQLLTANDLMALQHVQMDAAGLSGFWPVVEHALLEPGVTLDFELAAGLRAGWDGGEQSVSIKFCVFSDIEGGNVGAYRLWQRALRTLLALCDSHGLQWQVHGRDGTQLDCDGRLVRDQLGPTNSPEQANEHVDQDIGLIAWSVVEDGRLSHLYPLDAATARQVQQDLRERFPSMTTQTLAELPT